MGEFKKVVAMDESIFCLETRAMITKLLTFTDAHLVLFPTPSFVKIISHGKMPYLLKLFLLISPDVLISLIFTWLNRRVKHLFYDHSKNLAVLLMQLNIIEDIYLLGNLLSGKNINGVTIIFFHNIFCVIC